MKAAVRGAFFCDPLGVVEIIVSGFALLHPICGSLFDN